MLSPSEVHGLLVIDKPPGPTSHDVVAQARRMYGTRRVGHTGTLDPMATGVLVLMFGEATKLSPMLTAVDKHYTARVVFGYSTDSDDAFGNPKRIANEIPDLAISRKLEEALEVERNRVWQVPPSVSAIKQNGKRAYERVRRGGEVTLEPRAIALHRLCVTKVGANFLDLELHCSKGYYVRALARDLGESLACPAHLGELRRVRTGPFDLEAAIPWPPSASLPTLLPIVETVRRVMPTAQLKDSGAKRARCGQPLTDADFAELPLPNRECGNFAWIWREQLVAIGEYRDDNSLRVTRGFASQT